MTKPRVPKAVKRGWISCFCPSSVITHYTEGMTAGPVITLQVEGKEISIMMPHAQFALFLLERCPIECGVIVKKVKR